MKPKTTQPANQRSNAPAAAEDASTDVAVAQRSKTATAAAQRLGAERESVLGKRHQPPEPTKRITRSATAAAAAAAAAASAAVTAAAARSRPGQWPEQIEVTVARNEARAGLSTLGRPLPTLNPQSVGRYMTSVVGDWPNDRNSLRAAVLRNLQSLQHTDAASRDQHHLELTTHWHCLSETEKSSVLEAFAASTKPAAAGAATPAHGWLEHTTLCMEPAEHSRLLRASGPAAKALLQSLPDPLKDVTADHPALKRFEHLANTMPMDHMFDYGGFMKATNRVYGSIPESVKKGLHVLVVGAGPAGIVAADGLNRLGVKVSVVEQHGDIGGRIRTVRQPAHDSAGGRDSPTPMEMGAMRFAPYAGNSYHTLIQQYGLQTEPFPNPSSVTTSYVLTDRVLELAPGEAPKDPLMMDVKDEFERAMAPLLEPIMRARAAGDTAKLRTLFQSAFDRFDDHTFRSGMDSLLQDQGIKWDDQKWDLFNAIGIGVGGYSGYASTTFLEEFKFLADKRLEKHVFLPGGANSVLHAIKADAPPGGQSLDDQSAVELNTAVTAISKKDDGKYVVSTKAGDAEESQRSFTDVIFAAGPSEAKRLGLTVPRVGEQQLMTPDLARAINKANLVAATKLCIKVPKELLDGIDLPGNVQSDHAFQQMYVLPAVEGATSRAIFVSYQLGDNATKTASIDGQQQLQMAINVLRGVGGQNPADPAYQKVVNLANVLEQGKDRLEFMPWSQEPHFGGAFKMDRPSEHSNTQRLWRSGLEHTDGVIFTNEMMTGEGGFASGAVSAAINGVQQLIVRHGGALPAHSPLDQDALYR